MWFRFLARTNERTNEGVPRGPRGPKKKRKAATPGDGEHFASGCMLKPHRVTPNPPEFFSRGKQNSPDHLFVYLCPLSIHPPLHLSIHPPIQPSTCSPQAPSQHCSWHSQTPMFEELMHILLLNSKDWLPLGLSLTLAPSLNVSSKASSQATDSNCRWVSKGRKRISCYFITTWSNRDWCSARKPPGKKGQMCPEDRGAIYVIRCSMNPVHAVD